MIDEPTLGVSILVSVIWHGVKVCPKARRFFENSKNEAILVWLRVWITAGSSYLTEKQAW